MVGSWIPQLSSKGPGLVADGGKTWDAADIVSEYQSLQTIYPGARPLWTGDFTNYQGRNFWATVAAQSMRRPRPPTHGATLRSSTPTTATRCG